MSADVESALRRLLAAEIGFEAFSEVFLRGHLWCPRGDEVGFLAVGSEGRGRVPVFTSEQALIEAEGPRPAFVVTGHDLLMLAPEGYGFVLDRGRPTETTILPLEREAA